MWGQIYNDYSLHRNFNVGFIGHKNTVHIQLSQWQYWWWFWFVLVWSLYFLIIIKTIIKKRENYSLILNTSLKSHEKWGDFLIALIPLSWCGAILINSNFILRTLEWQNKTFLFTIKIEGRNWYWVYKHNLGNSYKYKSQNMFIKTNDLIYLKRYDVILF